MNLRCALVLLFASGGCNRLAANIDFERMIDQEKYEAYEADFTAPDRGVMRQPPAGTVPRGRILDPRLGATSRPGGPYVEHIPLVVDRALLERGRDRFDRFCAACHGVSGYGNQPVVENMALRPPPSLHEPRIKNQPVGAIFSTITNGFGLMPSYHNELEPHDRWAVVAYLQALWLSEAVALAELPASLQARAREELR